MSDQAEVVLAYWREHREQLRQSETQRAVLTNYVLVIASALTGLAVQQRLARDTWPLAAVVALVGVYGAISVAKYHERADYHLSQARALTKALVGLGVLPTDDTLLEQYRQTHYTRYPRLRHVRLHILWTGLHCAIAVLGLALTITVLFR